jgi:hypothetical protein
MCHGLLKSHFIGCFVMSSEAETSLIIVFEKDRDSSTPLGMTGRNAFQKTMCHFGPCAAPVPVEMFSQ